MSEYQLVNAPALAPGVDYLTRSAQGPFVDTGIDAPQVNGRGVDRIYLSVDTIRFLADLAGVTSRPDDEALGRAKREGIMIGIKEDIGGDIRGVVRTLDRLVGHLRDGLDGGPDPDER